MSGKGTVFAAALAALTLAPWCAAEEAAAPKVEVAFVLDTTGSMSGLINGAKAKIWYIANQIVQGEPRPELRIALVAYRDKGDGYVTKVFDLTDNIDQVYADLQTFTAQGGGDRPEHVNKALHDAVHSLSWSEGDAALKVIYLVGDSPPHNEYQDTDGYADLAKAAITKGIYVNTILCGGHQDTAAIWREIARLAEGRYFAIAQDGGVQDIATPYDERLSKLNAALVGTVVVYGTEAEQAMGIRLNKAAGDMAAAPAAAERASFAAETGRAGTQDLVAAVKNGEVSLEEVDSQILPPAMRKMAREEQAAYITAKQVERDTLASEIRKLSEKRAAYVKAELENTGGKGDGFDEKVLEALREQGRTKNISYD